MAACKLSAPATAHPAPATAMSVCAAILREPGCFPNTFTNSASMDHPRVAPQRLGLARKRPPPPPRRGSASHASASASGTSTTTAAMMPTISVPMRLSGARLLTSHPTASDPATANAGPTKPKPAQKLLRGRAVEIARDAPAFSHNDGQRREDQKELAADGYDDECARPADATHSGDSKCPSRNLYRAGVGQSFLILRMPRARCGCASSGPFRGTSASGSVSEHLAAQSSWD